jgi:hypothetical protein
MAQPGPHLSATQLKLHTLCRRTVAVVQFLSNERCQEAADGLVPFYEEAFQASKDVVNQDLEEMEGSELIEAILQPSTPSKSKAPARSNTDKKRSRNEDKRSPAAKPHAAAPPPSARKSERRGNARKKLAVAEDAPKKEVTDEITPWDYASHSNVASVVRTSRRKGVFGLIVEAAKSGQGNKKTTRFFADRVSLATVDAEQDKDKRKKVVSVLSKGVCELLDDSAPPELVELLQGSQWGQKVLADREKRAGEGGDKEGDDDVVDDDDDGGD